MLIRLNVAPARGTQRLATALHSQVTGQCCATESGTADAAASDIISKAMGAKDEATDEPLGTSGDVPAEASDDLLPGGLHCPSFQDNMEIFWHKA